MYRTITVNSQDLGDAGTIDTYQVFTGGDIEDGLIEQYNDEHGTNYGYDDFDIDYNHKQIVRDFADVRAKALEQAYFVKSVKVNGSYSPKEYNFSTDSADFEITYDADEVGKIIIENAIDYDKWYKDSGWASHIDWRDEGEKKQECIEIARLDYALNKVIDQDTAYWSVAEHETEIYVENITLELKKGGEIII